MADLHHLFEDMSPESPGTIGKNIVRRLGLARWQKPSDLLIVTQITDCGIRVHSKPLLLLLYIYLFFVRYRQSLDEQLEQLEKYKALMDKQVSLATNY